jgi:raffinose/stachyose/melibiose transport system permease protein
VSVVSIGRTSPAGGSLDSSEPPLARFASRKRAHVDPPPGEPRRVGYLYILPAFVFFGLFVLFPMGHSLWLSFTNWDGLTPAKWVGLANYRQLLSDPDVRAAFSHALVLVIFYSFIPVTIGLLLAASLSRMRVRGMTFFRTVLFLPQVIAMVVVGVIWRWMYTPLGSVNALLRAVGLGSLQKVWLGDFTWTLPALGLVGTWVAFGLTMVLFLAGVQKIPTSLYDAARVDGAGPVREFLAVTLPGLRNEIVVALTLTILAALRSFDLIWVTTKGGPGNSSSVPALILYERAFVTNQVGSAAAIGMSLTLVCFVVVFLVTRLGERRTT